MNTHIPAGFISLLTHFQQRKPNRVFFFFFFFQGRTKQSFSGAARFKLSMSNQQNLFPYEIKKNFCGEIQWETTGVRPQRPELQGQTSGPRSDLPTPVSVLTISNTTPLKAPNYKSARRKRKLQPRAWISVTVETIFYVHTYTYYTAGQPGVTHRCTGFLLLWSRPVGLWQNLSTYNNKQSSDLHWSEAACPCLSFIYHFLSGSLVIRSASRLGKKDTNRVG